MDGGLRQHMLCEPDSWSGVSRMDEQTDGMCDREGGGLMQVVCAAPVVSYEVPVNAATSGGATVTISGLNFGVYGFTPTGHAVGDVDCGTTSWSSATTAQCLLSAPITLSTSYSKVTVGAVVGTKSSSVFTFDGKLMC